MDQFEGTSPDPDEIESGEAAARKTGSSTSTNRVIAILDYLARTPENGAGVRQMASDLGLSRSAVSRILLQLADLRVVRMAPSGNYEPGVLMAAWGHLLRGRHDFDYVKVVGDVAADLVSEVGETASIYAYAPGASVVTYVDSVMSESPVQYFFHDGWTTPLHLGACGKVVLANLPPSAANRYLKTVADQVDMDALGVQLERIRSTGFAISQGENIPDASAISSAILQDGTPIGAISIIVPTYRADQSAFDGIGAKTAEAAREISQILSRTGAAN